MSYDNEVAREYLRNAFMDGALCVNGSAEALEGFVRIFAGEMEALIAVEQNADLFLEEHPIEWWVEIAQPSGDSVRHLKSWKDRIHG